MKLAQMLYSPVSRVPVLQRLKSCEGSLGWKESGEAWAGPTHGVHSRDFSNHSDTSMGSCSVV